MNGGSTRVDDAGPRGTRPRRSPPWSRTLAGELSLRPLLERILKRSTELLGCDAGSICLVDEACGRLSQRGGHRHRLPVRQGVPAHGGNDRRGRGSSRPGDLRGLRRCPWRARSPGGPGSAQGRDRRPHLVAGGHRRLLRGVHARPRSRVRPRGCGAARAVRQARGDRDHERPPARGGGIRSPRRGRRGGAQPDGPRGARRGRAGARVGVAAAPRGPGIDRGRPSRRSDRRARRGPSGGRGRLRGDEAQRARTRALTVGGPVARRGARARDRVGEPHGRARRPPRDGR